MNIHRLVALILFVLSHLQLLTLQQSDNFFFDQNLYSQIQSFSSENNRFSEGQNPQTAESSPSESSSEPTTPPTTTTSSYSFVSIQRLSSSGLPTQIPKQSVLPEQSIVAVGSPNINLATPATTLNLPNISMLNLSTPSNGNAKKNESIIKLSQRGANQSNSNTEKQTNKTQLLNVTESSNNKLTKYNNNTDDKSTKDRIGLNQSNMSNINSSSTQKNSTALRDLNLTKPEIIKNNSTSIKLSEKTSNSNSPIKKQSQKNNTIKTENNLNQNKSIETNIKTSVSQNIQKGSNSQSNSFSTIQRISSTSIQQSNTKSSKGLDPFADFGFSSSFSSFQKQFANLKKQFNARIKLRNLDQFPGITLASQVPLIFTLDEIYRFKGKVSDPTSLKPSQNSVTIVFKDVKNKGQFRCVEPLQNNQIEFEISCKLKMPGNFFLFIFASQSGVSSRRFRIIRQKNSFPSFSFTILEPPKPQNLTFNVIDNQLYIQWDSSAPITNLTLYQKQGPDIKIRKQFILSNYHQNYSIQFQQFADFKKQITYIQVTHADSDDGTLYQISTTFSKQSLKGQLMATNHLFQKDKDEKIQIYPPIPWRIEKGDTVKFTGTFKQDFNNQVYIILPNRKIIKVWFFKSTTSSPPIQKIGAYTKISLEITFPDEGIYILEVNNMAGQALINRPLYVGKIYPLLPDFVDISSFLLSPPVRKENLQEYIKRMLTNQTTIQPNESQTIQVKRLFFLKLLNALRKTYDLNPLVLDDKLNQIAQMHSDDMRDNNFLGHTNMRGQGPEQRAKRMNFLSSVGQNIAAAPSLIQAHLYLQRSAGHLENSIGEWTRVGVGISKNSENQYLVTVNFSIRDLIKIPLTMEEIQKIEKQIEQIIKQKNPNLKEMNKEISQEIRNWMKQPGKLNVLEFLVKVKKLRGSFSSTNFSLTFSKDMGDRIRKNNYFTNFGIFKQFGLAIKSSSMNPNLLEGNAVFRA